MNRLVLTSLLLALVLSNIAPPPATAAPVQQTATPPDPRVAQILDDLTPEERVGQLFVVTFNGTATDDASAIHELISEYYVGGVVLSATNDNFTDTDSFATSTLELTTNLQSIAAGVPPDAATPTAFSRSFIPLFIATAYPDARLGNVALLPGPSGLTPLPNSMTLGATWTPQYAQVTGRITGQELSALGINMLLGPTLDVIESPQPGSSADLGARAFGGDPYWVGKMGRAFIQGVHEGSLNRIAVVSQHFPGYGASDRALDEPQLPTVSKTLDELQAIDLAPFFDVVQVGAPDSTDALLVSHIRYRGLQGNIRDTTRPISLDQQALSDLLNLPELAAWRANGGVTVSDALGVRAVRRFYDPSERTFNAYAIARDAFLAGNDVLYLGQFASAGADRNAHIKDVLAQFVQKYQEDPAFAQRVDAAVTRIIALKFKLYGDFNWGSVQPEVPLNALGTGSLDSLAATTAAATLLSPAPAELANRLPTPPGLNHQIAFFTDTRIVKQCSSCAARPSIPVDALENAVLKLYGSAGTSEISSLNLNSFSFVDLADFLDSRPTPVTPTPSPEPSPTPEGATPEPTPTAAPPGVAEALDEADWIVFAMLDVKEGIAESSAVSRILAERPALLQDKRVIVFALDAPYYLDATDVAQLTAYYALYSRSSAAIEVAARILFQEITPSGASPVSVESVGYKLIDATQPDPDQIIELAFEIQPTEGATPSPVDVTITPSPPSVKLGDLLTFRTGLIVDRNGRPVPDGTVVKFYVTYGEVPIPGQFAEATTVDGVATTTFRLDRAGFFEFRVSSEPALGSFLLQFTVPDEGIGGAPIVITPTPGPTDTAPPTAPPTETPTPGITPTPIPPPPPITPSVTWIDLLMTILTLSVMGGIAWRVTNSRVEAVSAGVKLILIIAIGALAGYNYYALKLPGAAMVSVLGFWAVPLMVWSGGLIGFGVGWWWLKRSVRAGQ